MFPLSSRSSIDNSDCTDNGGGTEGTDGADGTGSTDAADSVNFRSDNNKRMILKLSQWMSCREAETVAQALRKVYTPSKYYYSAVGCYGIEEQNL